MSNSPAQKIRSDMVPVKVVEFDLPILEAEEVVLPADISVERQVSFMHSNCLNPQVVVGHHGIITDPIPNEKQHPRPQ